MKRLVRLVLIIAALGFAMTRLKGRVRFGTVTLDDAELSKHVAEPLHLTVVGMVVIPGGTSTGLVAEAVRQLRVVGLLEADRDVLQTLSGRVVSIGAVHTRD